MAYTNNNLDALQQQIQGLQHQYAQLLNFQPQPLQQAQFAQPVQVQVPIQSHQIQYVEGMAGAKLYQDNLPANSSEIILDKDDDILYRVSKDANGTPSKHIIKCRFTIEDYQEEEPAFLTRKDFDNFKEEIRQMLSNSNSKTVTLSSSASKK